MEEKIVYFEFNNWFAGRDYPDAEPFVSWLGNDLHLNFDNEQWVKENELCVKAYNIDMSCNFLITAKESWVKENCPSLLSHYQQFLRYPDEYGDVRGREGEEFLEYKPQNIGITYAEEQY